jgi:hypothetical protein
MKRPGPSASWFTFIDVFHHDYWLALGITMIILSGILSFSLLIHDGFKHDLKTIICSSNILRSVRTGICANLLSIATLDVGLAKNISHFSSNSIKILFLTICGCGMMNHYVYDACLTSHLMVQLFDVPIKKLSDILDKPDYQLLVWRGGADESFFSEGSHPILQSIWRKTLDENNAITGYSDGEQLVLKHSNMILFAESPHFQSTYESYPCNIISAPTPYGQHSGAYAFATGSPFSKMFGYYITQIQEAGLLPTKKNRGSIVCPVEGGYQPLGYDKLYSAFVFGGVGSIISVFHCIMELLHNVFKTN